MSITSINGLRRVHNFIVRLYRTGFGFQANIVEEYVLLSESLHISVGLVRTWDQKLSPGLMSGQLNLAITRSMLLTVITIHLFHSRFENTEPKMLRSPPTLVNWHRSLQFFWTDNTHVFLVPVRGFLSYGYKVLKNPVWCGFLAPSLGFPKYAPDAVIGALRDGGEEEGGYTMEEVEKHNKKGDVWVVLSNIGTQVGWSLWRPVGTGNETGSPHVRFGTNDGHHDGFLVTMCDCSMYGWSFSLLPVELHWHPSRLITLTLLFKTWDQKLSSGLLLSLMASHLFQFRFADK